MKIYNFVSNLSQITGVQKVMLDIHEALKVNYDISFASYTSKYNINPILNINDKDYVQIDNIYQFKNALIFVHERRIAFQLGLIKKLRNLKVIYVHHSEMFNYTRIPIFANKIISISDSGYNNLTTILHFDKTKICKIHNCVKDINHTRNVAKFYNNGIVNIALIGTIYDVKRQIDIVRNLKDRIPENVRIDFIGAGPQYSELISEIGTSPNFRALGFQSNVTNILQNYNYVLLFSKHEGLPISLIEASMMGIPIISNNVGGCPEIVRNNYNGYIVNTFNELENLLNRIINLNEDYYLNLAKNSRKIYESLYTFDLFKQNYNELVSSLIN